MKKSESTIQTFLRPIGAMAVLIFILILISKWGAFDVGTQKSLSNVKEIEQIKATTDIEVQEKLYLELIDRVGPAQAQDELYRSGMPFTGQTHLLNHIVGDYLYEKFGTKGLVQCRDYFLSSCYHGFILHAISDGGMPRVAETFEECLKSGPTVSSQCAHGIGHGFLANAGYGNLTKALTTCDEAERTMQGFPVFNCYDGVFMENIWAVHDGAPSPDRWVKENDPVYPCNDSRIDEKYLLGCWSNQPSLAYQLLKGDIAKVSAICEKITNSEQKQMCYDGLSRQIHPMTEGKVDKTLAMCGLIKDKNWVNFCISVNAGASYSVGDRVSPFDVCRSVAEAGKNDCYGRLFGMMRAYLKPGENFKDLCSKVKESVWKSNCLASG